MSHRITVRKGERVIKEATIGTGLVIGRHPSVEVQLEDAMISRQHARITADEDEVTLTDLGSVNGVQLNGKRIEANQPVPVRNGDVARIHDYEVAFAIEERFATAPVEPESVKSEPAAAPAAPPVPATPAGAELDDDERCMRSDLIGGHIPVWQDNQEAELVVADIVEETHDVKTYRLVGKNPIQFSYKPGQFITLKLDIDGQPVTRCYSISSTPSRPHTLEMTIKRVPGGLVSNYLYENIKLGDTLAVKGPAGSFSCVNNPKRKIGLIAGGSGVTPIMSMCRWIVDTTADVDVVMLIGARSPSDIIFRKELEVMSARHTGVQVYIAVSSGWTGTESWTGLTGRVSTGMLQMVMPDLHDRHLFMCGPPAFMDNVRKILKGLDFNTAHLYSESFGPARKAPDPDVAVEPADVPKGTPSASFNASDSQPIVTDDAPAGLAVHFQDTGVRVPTDGAATLLDLAEANGVGSITPGCRMGSCCMCKVKKASGDVRMDDNMLPDDLKAEGYVLTCVGYPQSDVTLEA